MKNKDILLDVIGDTDEALIPEPHSKKKGSRKSLMSAIGIGTCAAVILAGVMLLPQISKPSPPSVILPDASESESASTDESSAVSTPDSIAESENPSTSEQETINGKRMLSAAVTSRGDGYEGLMAYDISELNTPNPWPADPETDQLPVYRNLTYSAEWPSLSGSYYLREERMEEIALQTAQALHTEITSMEATYVKDLSMADYTEEIRNSVYCLDVSCADGSRITVYGNGEVRIKYSLKRNDKELPPGYSFTSDDTTPEEALESLAYLSDTFSDLLQYEHPVCYSYADRSFSGEENRSYYIYNKTEDPVQDILNFSLSYTSFAPVPGGGLIIWITDTFRSSEYLDDYPIITAEEATALLLSGSYFSSVPAEYIRGGTISEEDIARTELVYRNSSHEEYYQPYYRFYVELDAPMPAETPDGLKDFGIFYVPAVHAEYLQDF